MPLKLISPGGGSVILSASSTGSTYTLTVPAVNANVITDTAGSVTQSMLSSGLTTTGPSFAAYLSVDQNISTGSYVKVQLNAEEWDSANCFDSTTNYRFTPNVAGYYQINASIYITYNTAGGGIIQTVIYKNGAAYRYGMAGYTTTGNVGMYGMYPISSLVYLNGSTDYIELYGYASSGTAYKFNSAIGYTWMNGFLARAA